MDPTIFDIIDNLPAVWNQMDTMSQIVTGSVLGLFGLGAGITTYKVVNRGIYRPVKAVVTAPFKLVNRIVNRQQIREDNSVRTVNSILSSDCPSPNEIDAAVIAVLENNGQVLKGLSKAALRDFANKIRGIQVKKCTQTSNDNLVMWKTDWEEFTVGRRTLEQYMRVTRLIGFYLNQFEEDRNPFRRNV